MFINDLTNSKNTIESKDIKLTGERSSEEQCYISINRDTNSGNYIIGSLNTDNSISRLVFQNNKLVYVYFSDSGTYVGQTVIAEITV